MHRKASESGYTATGATILIDFYDIYDEIICQIIPFFLLKSLNLYLHSLSFMNISELNQPDTELLANCLNIVRTWWLARIIFKNQHKMAQSSYARLVCKLLSPSEKD